MMIRTKLAAVAGGLLFGFAAGGTFASFATPQLSAVAPVMMQLARHGHDDVGCDDHGTDLCAVRGGGDQVARHGHDDVGCDDHGTDLCAAGDRSREA